MVALSVVAPLLLLLPLLSLRILVVEVVEVAPLILVVAEAVVAEAVVVLLLLPAPALPRVLVLPTLRAVKRLALVLRAPILLLPPQVRLAAKRLA